MHHYPQLYICIFDKKVTPTKYLSHPLTESGTSVFCLLTKTLSLLQTLGSQRSLNFSRLAARYIHSGEKALECGVPGF